MYQHIRQRFFCDCLCLNFWHQLASTQLPVSHQQEEMDVWGKWETRVKPTLSAEGDLVLYESEEADFSMGKHLLLSEAVIIIYWNPPWNNKQTCFWLGCSWLTTPSSSCGVCRSVIVGSSMQLLNPGPGFVLCLFWLLRVASRGKQRMKMTQISLQQEMQLFITVCLKLPGNQFSNKSNKNSRQVRNTAPAVGSYLGSGIE